MKKKLLLVLFLASVLSMDAQWVAQNTGFPAASRGVEDITIVDANTVWALGYDGSSSTPANVQQYTRTSNGGTVWNSGNINIGNTALDITNITAVDANTAWVGAVHPTNGLGGVWKTSNGGSTWTRQNPSAYSTTGALASFFNVVHFFDANNGITQGDPIGAGFGQFEVFRTTDGGNTWTAPTTLPAPLSGEYGYNGGNVGAGNSFWFVTNRGKLYRTTDMGVTWTKLDTPITDFSATAVGGSIYFSDNNNGILLGRSGSGTSAIYTLYKTSNGGTTWDTGARYNHPYRSLTYIPGTSTLVGTGFTGSGITAVYYTGVSQDNGTTWTQIDSGTQRTSIAFLNATTGWAGGFTNSLTLEGGIFKYTGAALGIEDAIASSTKLKAYPNPANSQLTLNGIAISEVAVYDILGKQVMGQQFSLQDQVTLNVSSLENGMYVLVALNENGAKETIKFAKR